MFDELKKVKEKRKLLNPDSVKQFTDKSKLLNIHPYGTPFLQYYFIGSEVNNLIHAN